MKIYGRFTLTELNGNARTAVEVFKSEPELEGYHNQLLMGSNGVEVSLEILNPEQIKEFLKPLETAVILADRKKAEAKKILDESSKANKTLFNYVGPNYYFQDDETITYKTDVCDGKFVHFDPVEIKRTRRPGETKGSLSMTDAREHGFEVEGK